MISLTFVQSFDTANPRTATNNISARCSVREGWHLALGVARAQHRGELLDETQVGQ